MRVLTTTTPSRSSVQPAISLCRALHEAGHDVLIAIAPNYTEVVRRAGLEAVGAGPAWDHAEADQFIPGWIGMPSHAYMATMAEVAGRGIVEDVLPLAESWQPDVIVHVHHDLGGWIVAERLGIPNVPFAVSLRWLDPGLLRMFAGQQVENLLARYDLPPDPEFSRPTRWLYLETAPRPLTEGFFPEAPTVHHVRYVSDDTEGDPSLPTWIDELAGRRLVYVTMGTVFNRVGNLLRTLTQGAAMHDVEVIVTHGGGVDLADLGELPPNVHVEAYVPHSSLIPRCAAVVCQASAANVFGALAEAVPLVLTPLTADQPANASLCVQKGFGVSCATSLSPGETFPATDPDELTPEQVADALGAVLDSDSY
ncbi:MAG: glycosyltransferase, partial [Candidatus Rokuibacteriota bacterium]